MRAAGEPDRAARAGPGSAVSGTGQPADAALAAELEALERALHAPQVRYRSRHPVDGQNGVPPRHARSTVARGMPGEERQPGVASTSVGIARKGGGPAG
ncbi:hypothetical protein CCR98_04635 [Stenotrophomonas sp. WZN-1]|nr:hypothetical protein CCR98_04635 [Stenotrophomonas sp. WZN-1]